MMNVGAQRARAYFITHIVPIGPYYVSICVSTDGEKIQHIVEICWGFFFFCACTAALGSKFLSVI